MGPTGPAGPAGTGGSGGSSATFTSSEIFPWNSTNTVQDTDGGSTFALITDSRNYFAMGGQFANIGSTALVSSSWNTTNMNSMIYAQWASGSEHLFTLYLGNQGGQRLWYTVLNSIDFRDTGFSITTLNNVNGGVNAIDYVYINGTEYNNPNTSNLFPISINSNFWTTVQNGFYIYIERLITVKPYIRCTFYDNNHFMFFRVVLEMTFLSGTYYLYHLYVNRSVYNLKYGMIASTKVITPALFDLAFQ